MIITHIKAPFVSKHNVFDNVKNLNELDKAIVKFGKGAPIRGDFRDELFESMDEDDTYANRLGWAHEIYVETFMKKGLKEHPAFGITDVQGTSQNKFNGGFDFTARNFKGELVLIQAKFRSNPCATFTRHELGSFVSWADTLDVTWDRRILFTNLKHAPGTERGSIFHPSYTDGVKQMRVLGKIEQEGILDRDPSFWE